MRYHFGKYIISVWIGLNLVLLAGCHAGPASPEKVRTLRVLTYNIHHGQGTDGRFDYERLAKVVNDLAPDIVALQEVDRETDRVSGLDQAALLSERCQMHYVFGPAMPFQNGQYGQAILSRFPFDKMTVHTLPQHLGREPRVAVETHITVEGIGALVFISTHLCHQDNDVRLMQTRRLAELFADQGGPPLILAGDFNARADSDPMRVLLEEGWIDTIAPKSIIDYILVRASDPWKIREVVIVDEPVVSDHDPILSILEWRGP